jgi:hypothetical protein
MQRELERLLQRRSSCGDSPNDFVDRSDQESLPKQRQLTAIGSSEAQCDMVKGTKGRLGLRNPQADERHKAVGLQQLRL